jgi:hypothetical protein
MPINSLPNTSAFRLTISLLAVIALLPFAFPTSARADNIFDDNWTPPPPRRPAPTPPAGIPVPEAAPKTPVPENPGAASAIPRRTIPAAPDQAQSRRLLKEVFAKQLADRAPSARRALAHQLLDEANRSSDNVAEHFVLLAGAIEAACEGGDLRLCLDAADRMAERYVIDNLTVKADAAVKALPNGVKPADLAADNVHAGLLVLDRLTAVADFAAATRLIAPLQQCAATNPALKATVQKRVRDVAEIHSAYDRMVAASEKLKNSPDDAAANLVVGRYFCFYQNQWNQGLPFLAKGSDSALASLARQDLANPSASEDRAGVADAWWKLAESQNGQIKSSEARRAAVWYRKALDDASGLRRTALQKRLSTTVGATADPQIAIYRLNHETDPFCFDAHDETIPDELTVSQASSAELRISGTKRSDATKVHNSLVGHFGKAALTDIRESSGTLEVDVAGDQHHVSYFMLVQEREGTVKLQRLTLRRGAVYSWSIAHQGDEVVFELRDPTDAAQKSIVIRSAVARAVGWGAECRSPGDKADLTVRFE